ncbi:MAG: thiamine-phosphate kinase [Actinobacteria bacterium]|nr:MAG: thiamine-phosphate kinase [Actinomycetota bacterium]
MDIKEIGEFGLIDKIDKIVYRKDKKLVASIGDDCAAFKIGGTKIGLLTTDSLVEDIHFKLKCTSPYDLGYKSIIASISDIASMAGVPLYCLVSLILPDYITVEFVQSFYRGAKTACNKYGCLIAGGDISGSHTNFSLNVSIYGESQQKLLRKRSEAKVGDLIFVTGPLGGSAAGLELLLKPETKASVSTYSKLTKKHLRPEAKVAEGLLASKNGATAMEDISDGLVGEVAHICEQSKIGAIIYVDKVPVDESIKRVDSLKTKAMELALSGGEDYELVFSCPKRKTASLAKAFNKKNLPLFEVGEITKGNRVKVLHNKEKEIKLKGYEHF